MPNIYTVGCQHQKLADLQAMTAALHIEAILDWRENPSGRLNQPTLERAFPGVYKYVGDSCNESKITDKSLAALANLKKTTLLLFHKEVPGNCARHDNLSIPLLRLHGIDVVHVFADELIAAKELQRSIDQDNDYQSTEWRAQPAQAAAPVTATTTHPAPIDTIADLADRAMLIQLHLYMLGLSRQNENLNAEISQKHGSDAAMTKVVESLLPKEAMARLSQLRSSIRQEFYRRTLPWQDGGTRILSTAGYMDFSKFMRDAQSQWEPAVQYFVDNWDSYVADAKVKRNGLFRAEQYPSKDQVKQRFEFAYQVFPVPVSSDFRAKVSADEVKVIKKQLEESLRQTVDASMSDIWQRLRKVVQDTRDRLKAASESDKSFRDSAITNITDLLSIVPSLNLTGDTDVADFCAEIQRELTTYEPQTLRDDAKAREQVVMRADEILAKMSAYL